MKIQDITFIIVLLTAIVLRKPRLSVALGLFSLTLSIPLFYTWTFFTAQRLTYYAAAFFLYSIIYYFIQELAS